MHVISFIIWTIRENIWELLWHFVKFSGIKCNFPIVKIILRDLNLDKFSLKRRCWYNFPSATLLALIYLNLQNPNFFMTYCHMFMSHNDFIKYHTSSERKEFDLKVIPSGKFNISFKFERKLALWRKLFELDTRSISISQDFTLQ